MTTMLQKDYTKRTPRNFTKSSSPRFPEITPPPSPQKDHKWKILCDKANELYVKTDYEQALLLYHRAQRERPNCLEARIGIRRCEDSINTVLIEPVERVTQTRATTRQTRHSSPYSTGRRTRGSTSHSKVTKFSEWAYILPNFNRVVDDDPHAPTVQMRHDASHVITLKNNKSYMKSIYDQLVRSVLVKGDVEIKKILVKEMEFVKTMGNFWRHQIPIETIPKLFKVKEMKLIKDEEVHFLTPDEAAQLATEQLMKVLEAYQNGEYQEAVDLGTECTSTLEHISALDVEYKDDVFGNVYSVIGNSYFEMDNVEKSIEWHDKDLQFAKKRYLDQAQSRALGNLGRSYAKAGNFNKAIELWTEKIAFCEDESEKAWLHHELGYCYLTINDFPKANQCGITSFEAAEAVQDYEWQINSCVLIAQAEVAQGYLKSGLETYNQAAHLCDWTGNFEMKESIDMAMEQITALMQQQEEIGSDTSNRPASRESRRSQKSRQSSTRLLSEPICDETSRSKQTSRQSVYKRNDSPSKDSKHLPATVERPLLSPKKKSNLKSASHVTFGTIQEEDKENKFESKSNVNFSDSKFGSVSSLHESVTSRRSPRKAKQLPEKRKASEPVHLPPINHSIVAAKEGKKGVAETEHEHQEKPWESGHLFDDTDDLAGRGRKSPYNLQSRSFYINTSSTGRISRLNSAVSQADTVGSTDPRNTGRISRLNSAVSQADSVGSTDPRNALTDSDYLPTQENFNNRSSLSRQSRISWKDARESWSRQNQTGFH